MDKNEVQQEIDAMVVQVQREEKMAGTLAAEKNPRALAISCLMAARDCIGGRDPDPMVMRELAVHGLIALAWGDQSWAEGD